MSQNLLNDSHLNASNNKLIKMKERPELKVTHLKKEIQDIKFAISNERR